MLDFWCRAALPIHPHASDHFTRGVVQVDSAGIDLLLVGDSAGMVVHGHDTTLPVTVSDMMLHCQAVSRGSRRAFRIADLPFGSYESSPQQAIETAISFMKLGNMDAVKLEGKQMSVLISAGHVLSICPHLCLAAFVIQVDTGTAKKRYPPSAHLMFPKSMFYPRSLLVVVRGESFATNHVTNTCPSRIPRPFGKLLAPLQAEGLSVQLQPKPLWGQAWL